MTTAFVLSGGASLGAVQVGMLQALGERDVTPDLLVGTSSGALNAAFLATRGAGLDRIAELGGIWRSLHTFELFRPDPLRAFGALLGRTPSFFTHHGMTELIAKYIDYDELQDAAIPLTDTRARSMRLRRPRSASCCTPWPSWCTSE